MAKIDIEKLNIDASAKTNIKSWLEGSYDEQTKHYRLSPCYDLTTQPNSGIHQLGFGWKDVPTKTDLFALADKVGIGRRKAESIMQKVLAIVRKRLSKYYSFSGHIGRAFER